MRHPYGLNSRGKGSCKWRSLQSSRKVERVATRRTEGRKQSITVGIEGQSSRGQRRHSKEIMLKRLTFTVVTGAITIIFIVLRLLYLVPWVKNQMLEMMKQMTMLETEQFKDSFLSWEMYMDLVSCIKQDIFKIAQLKMPAPDVKLLKIQRKPWPVLEKADAKDSLESNTSIPQNHDEVEETDIVSLKSLMRCGVPLVLNFGSCS